MNWTFFVKNTTAPETLIQEALNNCEQRLLLNHTAWRDSDRYKTELFEA